jgi:enoyl-CoA hydratase
MVRRFLEHPDLVEGITARVVDRTHTPRWSPARLADVRAADVDAFFAPLGADELHLPG